MLDKIKSLSKQTLVYGTSTIIGRFLNFILVPFYTNVFPPSEYGVITLIFAYTALLNIFFSIGFESGYFKFASTLEVGDRKENFSLPFLTILINSLIFSSIIYSFSSDFSVLIGIGENYSYFISYTAFILLFDAISLVPFANLRLNNKAGLFAAIKIVNISVNVALNFLLVLHFRLGLVSVFISNVAASAVTFLLLLPVVLKNITFRFNKELFGELLRFSLPYVPAGLASIMVQVISRPIMLMLTDEATVGIFQANFKLGIFMMLIVSMFEYAWRPFFLNNAKEPNAKQIFSRVMTIFVGLASLVLIVLTFFIDDLIRIPLPHRGHIIGAKYWGGVYIVPLILYSYLVYGMYINLMAGIYIEKKTGYLPFITGLGAVINIAGSFALIPVLGMLGAAIATFLSYLAMTVYIYYVTHKFYPVKYESDKIALLHSLDIIAVVMFYLLFFSVIPANIFIKLTAVVVLSIAVFFVSGLTKAKVLFERSKEPAKDDLRIEASRELVD